MLCNDSHLEEVGSLRDYRRVQVLFGSDVVGILEKLVPLGKETQGQNVVKSFFLKLKPLFDNNNP